MKQIVDDAHAKGIAVEWAAHATAPPSKGDEVCDWLVEQSNEYPTRDAVALLIMTVYALGAVSWQLQQRRERGSE
jgi:hypothetical protein